MAFSDAPKSGPDQGGFDLTKALEGLTKMLQDSGKWLEGLTKGFGDALSKLMSGTRDQFAALKNMVDPSASADVPAGVERVDNPAVQRYLVKYYVPENTPRPMTKEMQLKYDKYHAALGIWKAAKAHAPAKGVEPLVLFNYMMGIAEQENNYNPKRRAESTGAYGLFQIMPENFTEWGLKNGINANVEEQTDVAARKMLEYYGRLKQWGLVSIAWYSGEGRANTIASLEAIKKDGKTLSAAQEAKLQKTLAIGTGQGKSIAGYRADVDQRMASIKSSELA